MINEDTGEEPTCVVCGAEWACERHLVACLDLTFGECQAGALFERDEEIWSRIDAAFEAHRRPDASRRWDDGDIQWLWEQFKATSFDDRDARNFYYQCVFEVIDRLLARAGASPYPGGAVDEDSAPDFSSSYSLLYAEAPGAVIARTLEILDAALKA
ncbi:MAG: hypothetical protein RIM84_09920 [Alphaproteobacteria bacterium]